MRAEGERPRRSSRPARQPRGPARLVLRFALAGSLIAVAVALYVAYGVRRSPAPRAASSSVHQQGPSTTTAGPSTTRTSPAPSTTTTAGPGTLPQTTVMPSATSRQFHSVMADLWNGVVRDQVSVAMPAFFPLGAYLQLKAIPDPQEDWRARLVGQFALDVAAAHALLGTQATKAALIAVDVPTQYAHWVTPGTCYNSIGYYEVPNARIVYRINGAIRSFGIASMISWRGQWYVVHLGAVLRATTGPGEVDDPATGPGTPAYSSTC